MASSPLAGSLRMRRTAAVRGFTLIEMMITLVVLALVATVLMVMTNMLSHGKQATQNAQEATQAAQAALDMMAEEIRSAGYGADVDYPGTPQPAIAYVDSTQIIFAANFAPYPDTTSGHGGPQAYDPTGLPQPFPLQASAWTPGVKFRTGAELIRYSLDANNDGTVSATDQSSPLGRDAQRTRNPNDFMLLRQVYGDKSNGTLHDNGGQTEAVALVSKPGGAVPPMFTVYLRGSTTAWNWANGPVPASQLADIQRITLQVTATSPQPDSRGRYATSTLRTEVMSTRNLPTFLTKTYAVDGYVFADLNSNHTQDTGENGIADVLVTVGNTYSVMTNASGYYLIRVPAGTYTIKHYPKPGYGNFTVPDSFVVTVGPGVQRSFADTAAAGSQVTVNVYNDADGNGVQDAGESGRPFQAVSCSPGGSSATTDVNGLATLFAPVGAFTVTLAVPDSLQCTTTNPVSGTSTNGGSVTVHFGMKSNQNGVLRGVVFIDTNRNGIRDGNELGSANTWVGVYSLGTGAIAGYANTDANGNYVITVPANNPPMTNPYYVYFLPPSGFFPTTAQAYGPVWITAATTTTGMSFGVAQFQIISLSASRVLSLATADLIENDWGTNTANARKDQDILLGADAGGSDNISVWFNQYNNTTLFNPSPTTPAGSGYTRLAPQSVQSIAVDTLDMASPIARPDVVTGTKKAANGNFFVWLNQNTSGNQGYLPTTFSTGLNYTTQDGGDVTSVLTLDCAGGNMPDLIVGTRSPTAGNGTIEIWQNSNAASPTFTRQEIIPPAGNLPGGNMGEVQAMALGDMDGDGAKDLVVVTRSSDYSGDLLVFKNIGRTNGSRFDCQFRKKITGDTPTCLALTDVNGDGKLDIVFATQSGTNTGNLMLWDNTTSGGSMGFSWDRQVALPGLGASIVAADMGGTGRKDIAVGWRQDASSYVGGVLVFYTDLNTIPSTGSDPASGSLPYFAPALTVGNYNYGLYPLAPSPPFLDDLGVGYKTSATTGALVIFVR
jgi:prepilin-type N-terminal cleavage/methylation domain-containing protein